MRITIYWATKDGGLIDRLRQRFGISAGISVNGETETEFDDKQFYADEYQQLKIDFKEK